jgi:hypothetical protein
MRMSVSMKMILLSVVLLFSAAVVFGVNLTIIGPPGAVLSFEDGKNVTIGPGGKYTVENLKEGAEVIFSTEIKGRYPSDYVIPIGATDKTFRLDPVPTGTVAFELKFTDADLCPGFGFEFYTDPEDVYFSIDLYQSFLGLIPIFTGNAENSSADYFMPMLGLGVYLLPHDFPLRLNLACSAGAMFATSPLNVLFAAEGSVGIELKFGGHYIIFAELNPRLLSPAPGGWEQYSDVFGESRAGSLVELGGWGLMAFPSTVFGLKIKY